MMDQLFVMQRYWGSDEEESEEKNSFKVTSPEKSVILLEKSVPDVPVIDLDSDDCIVPKKKQKIIFCLENNKNRTSEQKIDSFNNNNDIEIICDTKNCVTLKDINSNISINENSDIPFELEAKSVKKKKSKDRKKEKKSKEISLVDVQCLTLNSDCSVKKSKYDKQNHSEIMGSNAFNLEKEKKQRSRYFDVEENNESISVKHSQLNKESSSTCITNDEEKVSLQETFDVKERDKSKKKKSKRQKIDDSVEDTPEQSLNDAANKRSKQGLRYFNFDEVGEKSISDNEEELNSKANNAFKDEVTENILNGTMDTNNKHAKHKRLKFKTSEINESGAEFIIDKNSQIENLGEVFPTIGQVSQQKYDIVKHTLPQWLSNPTYISVNLQEKEIPISELSYLDSNTKNNLTKSGIHFLFPVQLSVIPWLIQSKEQSLLLRPSDICVSAPTGSGKTLAFVLPIVQSLKDRVVCAIRALVILPVSELAIQVYKVFETYIQGTDLKVALLTGKKSFIAEQNFLVKSTGQSMQSLVDIVVATPGRIRDHIYRTQGFCLKRLRYLVIDEADRMMEELQQGWLKQVEEVVFHDCTSKNCICSSYKRTFFEPTCAYNFGFISQPLQKLLYSATLTHNPEQLHTLSLYKPKLFTASSICLEKEYKGSCAIPPGIKMFQVICEAGIKPIVICYLIKHHKFKRVLCFTETIERAHRLHLVLEEMRLYQVREISSFNKPAQRKIALNQFRSGKVNILVCSDLVARGIDIQDIDCVISYDIPESDKIYTHRIGRTARAGKTGTAMTLLSEGEVPHFKKMISANPEIKLPEKVYIKPEDLKPLVKTFKTALLVADTKLKKEKSQLPGKSSKKVKRKQR